MSPVMACGADFEKLDFIFARKTYIQFLKNRRKTTYKPRQMTFPQDDFAPYCALGAMRI